MYFLDRARFTLDSGPLADVKRVARVDDTSRLDELTHTSTLWQPRSRQCRYRTSTSSLIPYGASVKAGNKADRHPGHSVQRRHADYLDRLGRSPTTTSIYRDAKCRAASLLMLCPVPRRESLQPSVALTLVRMRKTGKSSGCSYHQLAFICDLLIVWL